MVMTDKEMLDTIYDMLAQNPVEDWQRSEVLERIDHVNYDDMSIVFDQDKNSSLTLQVVRI